MVTSNATWFTEPGSTLSMIRGSTPVRFKSLSVTIKRVTQVNTCFGVAACRQPQPTRPVVLRRPYYPRAASGVRSSWLRSVRGSWSLGDRPRAIACSDAVRLGSREDRVRFTASASGGAGAA